jgi:hypothetical protein
VTLPALEGRLAGFALRFRLDSHGGNVDGLERYLSGHEAMKNTEQSNRIFTILMKDG